MFALTGLDTVLLLVFSVALLLVLVFAYLAKDEGLAGNYKVLHAQERLKYLTDLSEYSIAVKLAGTLIGISVFVFLWFVSVGLVLGIALFIVEFGVILLLPRVYNVPRPGLIGSGSRRLLTSSMMGTPDVGRASCLLGGFKIL